MSSEYVYANPPLQEVIVEIQWSLTDIRVLPGAKIDPFFKVFLPAITNAFDAIGFSIVENKIPEDVPLELVSYQATRLFRSQPGAWPIYQVGPGVMTANVVPPYGGWSSFRPHVETGLEKLFASYPTEFLKLERIMLRYINGFAGSHGMKSPSRFVRDVLKMAAPLPSELAATAKGGIQGILQTGALTFPIAGDEEGKGEILTNVGKLRDEDAVIMELRAIFPVSNKRSPSEAIEVLNRAHSFISLWFESLLDSELRAHLGEKTVIR